MAKRGQNEGSIYQRKDGRWTASIDLGWHDGRRHRKSFYGLTRREVQEKLTKALRAQQTGLPIPEEKQTVSQFLDQWLENSAKPSVKPKTFESYAQLVRLYLAPDLGRFKLAKLTPQQVQAFLNNRLASGLSTRTVQYSHAVLRHALNQALKWGMVARNVATLVSPPKLKQREIQPLTPDQVHQFLQEAKGNRLEALYSVAVAIGLREGEALGLRWPDVDLDAGTLTVHHSLQRVHGVPTFAEPKQRSRRTITLPAIAVSALHHHRTLQEQERLVAGSRWKEQNLVFATPIGTPLDPANLIKAFHKMLKRAGLPEIRFHDLRHTCATLLLAQAVHPRLVMDILGHSQISITLDTYSHVIPTMRQEVAAKMDSILNPVAVNLAVKMANEKVN